MKELHRNERNESVVEGALEEMVREGARRMLAAALEEEVDVFFGGERCERGEEFLGYHNGYHPSRELIVGVSAVEVKAPRVSERERLRDECVVDLSAEGRADAAETAVRDWESLVSFYDFPVERWAHLRTTNPLESVFSAVRLSERWRPLNGGRSLMGLLIDGAKFEDGALTESPVSAEEAVAA